MSEHEQEEQATVAALTGEEVPLEGVGSTATGDPEQALQQAKEKVVQLTEAADRLLDYKERKVRQQAMREFKDWKRTLTEMIRTSSSVLFTPDGGYQFILPTRLVRLVWATTIKERVRYERQQHPELTEKEASQRAMQGIKDEVAEHAEEAKAVLAKLEEQRMQATVDHLANHPPFAGEQAPAEAPAESDHAEATTTGAAQGDPD